MASISEILTNLTNKVNEIDKNVYPYNFLTFKYDASSGKLKCTEEWIPKIGKYYNFSIYIKTKVTGLENATSSSAFFADNTGLQNKLCYFIYSNYGSLGSNQTIWNICYRPENALFYQPQKFTTGSSTLENIDWVEGDEITLWYQEIDAPQN